MNIENGTINIGFNLIGHDSSVSYIDIDKELIFAIDEERITRFKHDTTSIQSCLDELCLYLGMNGNKVTFDLSMCYNNETEFGNGTYLAKRILSKKIRKAFGLREISEQTKLISESRLILIIKSILRLPKSFKLLVFLLFRYKKIESLNTSFKQGVELYLRNDFSDNKYKYRISFNDHHTCHCIGAYYFSPFERCLCLTLDFEGDQYFSKVFLCNKEEIKEIIGSEVIRINQGEIISIGRIFTHVTWFLGFTPNSDEGKVEAMAAYGSKNNQLYEKLISSTTINEDNAIVIDSNIMEYLKSNLNNIQKEIGDNNIAAATQGYLEDVVVKYVNRLVDHYQFDNLVLSGGTFANVKLNMSLFERSNAKQIYIFPAMSDAGAGLGALINDFREKKEINYNYFKTEKYVMPYWGNEYKKNEILSEINLFSESIVVEDVGEQWGEIVARYVCEGKICGLFHGRMEFGPRALGNRSILGDARKKETKDILNSVIKGRPSFQPFCPSILEEDRSMLFVSSYSNKHMTCAFQMKPEFAKILPSAVHIDGTARPQFVEESDNLSFYNILKSIKKITGYGVVVNTSFNKHGRTIVNKPSDAIRDFLDSGMDFIFFENILVKKINNN